MNFNLFILLVFYLYSCLQHGVEVEKTVTRQNLPPDQIWLRSHRNSTVVKCDRLLPQIALFWYGQAWTEHRPTQSTAGALVGLLIVGFSPLEQKGNITGPFFVYKLPWKRVIYFLCLKTSQVYENTFQQFKFFLQHAAAKNLSRSPLSLFEFLHMGSRGVRNVQALELVI